MALRWGLVGRTEELALLTEALKGDSCGAVLCGAPGVGKTRLATELLEHAVRQGRATAWTVGTRAMATVPFGAFAHLLPQAGDVVADAREVLRRTTEEFRRRSPDRPVVLGVDDAHLLDERSAELTHHLAGSGAAFVVATVRRGETTPEAISALASSGLVERIELQPLSAAEIGELLAHALGGQVDTTTHHRLWQACAGNVLFLRELARVGLERGSLAERDGVWSWSGDLAGGDRLTELVEDRLAGLNRQQRAALEVLAVGEPLPASLFADAVGRRVVDELEHRSLVALDLQRRRISLRLAHPLYAETLRAGLGAVRRQTICRRLADALAATGARRREDVLRLALWRLDGGGDAEPAAMIAAARWARSAFDHGLAERLARAALQQGGGAVAGLLLADALHWQGRYEEARTVLDAHPPGPSNSALIVEHAVVASTNYFWGLGDAARAEAAVLAAQQRLPAGPVRDGLTAHRATMAVHNGRPAEALQAVAPLLDALALGDSARVRTHTAATLALAVAGQCERALDAAAEGVTIAKRVREQRRALVGELLAAQAFAYWAGGRIPQLEQLATEVYGRLVTAQHHDRRGVWALLLGRAALAAGRAGSARDRLREAVTLLRVQDMGLLPWALSSLAWAAALLGELEDARRAWEEHEGRRLPSVRMFDGDAELAHAWIAAAGGEHSTARRRAVRAANLAAAAGQRGTELDALHDAVRLGEPNLQVWLDDVASRTDNVLAPVFLAHAAALAARDAAALDRCAERFAELGAPLLAAEAADAAADAHHQAGRSVAASRSRARSAVLASNCEGARTPGLRRSAPSLAALTVRERELAELAARGLTNREIADRLVLSVRTVANHLNHIYAKLGATGRADLAVALGMSPGDSRAGLARLLAEPADAPGSADAVVSQHPDQGGARQGAWPHQPG